MPRHETAVPGRPAARLSFRGGRVQILPRQAGLARRALGSAARGRFPQGGRRDRQGRAPCSPHYTGVRPEGPAYSCARRPSDAAIEQLPDGSGSWLAWRDATTLHVEVRCAGAPQGEEIVSLVIEPHRLDPVFRLEVSSAGHKTSIYPHPLNIKLPWDAVATTDDGGWTATFAIPFRSIPWYERGKPLRINVCRLNAARQCLSAWVALHPLPSRLLFGDHNSADLGWLVFPK